MFPRYYFCPSHRPVSSNSSPFPRRLDYARECHSIAYSYGTRPFGSDLRHEQRNCHKSFRHSDSPAGDWKRAGFGSKNILFTLVRSQQSLMSISSPLLLQTQFRFKSSFSANFQVPSIWTAKYTITEFLARLTAQTWRHSFQLMLNFIRIFLVATFAAVAISTLAECQPFHHYWQVNPMPESKCRQGYAHLVAMGACDAATDMLLVAFPIPIIAVSTMPIFRKLALTLLFALSLILVVITCYRVPAVIQRQGNQQYRSLFASLEIVVATAISNAIVIGSFMRDRGVKKQKYKIGSVSEASDQKFSRRATIANHEWGSDADLATDLGLRLGLEVKTPTYQEVWPAPIAHANKRNPEENDFT